MDAKMKTQFASICAGLLMTISAPAFAQSSDECSTDADCPDDFICESIEWGACPGCVPGEECPPCETGTTNVCAPPPPQQCDDSAPCGDGEVCVKYTFEECDGGAAPSVPCSSEDPDCGNDRPSDPPECSTIEESYCVPKYLAPCESDSDCGAGFLCETAEVCACSGGGSTGAAPGPGEDPDPDMGSGDPPEEPDCVCEPADTAYCQLIEVECTSDSDCVGDLTCQDGYGGGSEPSPGVPCMVDEDGNTDCPDTDPPEPVEPTSYCAPPGYGYYGAGVDGGGYGESVANATGRDDATVTNSEREEFFPVDGTDGDGDKQSPSSCSTANGGPSGSLLLLLVGLLLTRRRRLF